jgi:hypothetical protein
VPLDNNRLMQVASELSMSDAMKVIDRSVAKLVESVSAHTSSYVSSLMADITGYIETAEEESAPMPPTEAPSQLVHAGLGTNFEEFEPDLYGPSGGFF